MEGLSETVSSGDAIIVDVSSGDVEILEEPIKEIDQEYSSGAAEPAEPETLVDMSQVVAAIQSLESSMQQGFLSVCILLGCIAGILVVKGLWIGRD